MADFWRFSRMEGSTPQNVLYIDGEMMTDKPWFNDVDMFCTPTRMRKELDELPDGDLTVMIDSPGGDASCGVAIYTMLRECKRHVKAVVTARAYSAATLVLCGCDEVLMSPAAMLMVHNPCVDVGRIDENDLEEIGDYLRTLKAAVLAAYTEHTGMSDSDLTAVMNKVTWMTAQEAVDAHWATGVLEKSKQIETRSMMLNRTLAACMDGAKLALEAQKHKADAQERAELAAFAADVTRELA